MSSLPRERLVSNRTASARVEQPASKYWYSITYYVYQVCGDGPIERVRRFGKKPKRWEDRHDFYSNTYCGCLDHQFL